VTRLTRGTVSLGVALIVAGAALLAPATALAQGNSGNPCDSAPALPFCDSALGALRDVTAAWRTYEAATVQAVPISDYASDPQSTTNGTCGNETVNGTGIPPSFPATPPANPLASAHFAGVPPAIPPPPPGGWKQGTQYCVLRYIAADFTPPCSACVRLFVDYDKIPATTVATNPVAPGSLGHWAARMSPGTSMSATAMINGHSPNAKNLCSDKFFNPSPGAECAGQPTGQFVNGFDTMGLGIEGNTWHYHHFTLEGRYYNGPYYLAGDGTTVALHWVHGFYMDLNLGGPKDGVAYYTAGYAGNGDNTPDLDQSYACLVPCYLHTTYSDTIDIHVLGASTATPGGSTTGGTTAGQGGTPNTGTRRPLPAAPLGLLAAVVLAGALAARWKRG